MQVNRLKLLKMVLGNALLTHWHAEVVHVLAFLVQKYYMLLEHLEELVEGCPCLWLKYAEWVIVHNK